MRRSTAQIALRAALVLLIGGATACERGAAPSAALPGSTAEAPAPATESHVRANRLADEASPYLQLHAHNPVDWYPWGPEAFAKALVEDKPIFLSIGYSTCYWCHVMEREVFANEEIAALMNEAVVSIKVDREERPDIDEVYMTATQLLTGSGGWPNSLFLTPAGKPFYAGTYIPPVDRRGRAGFPTLLQRMTEAWEGDRAKLVAVSDRVVARISEVAALVLPTEGPVEIEPLVARTHAEFRQRFEPEHAGFSPRTKFPQPPMLELLLALQLQEPGAETLSMLLRTLDEMALGGLYDHVGGGFHRYATEPTWSVPHFEKMLYDNAQLVGLYARAYAATGRTLYRRVVEQTLAYVEREMRLAGGGLASAQDAEVAGEEGASYVWSRAEIFSVLGADAAAEFLAVYELVPLEAGPFGVLRVRLDAAHAPERFDASDVAELLQRFDADRARLLAIRDQRVQPLRDDKVIGAWNALAISGWVAAAEALDAPQVLARAQQNARFVLQQLRDAEGGLHRSTIGGQLREQGVLEDYALLADALLALHAATGDPHWERAARSLADEMLARFGDPEIGGFFDTQPDTELFVRLRGFEDSVLPSGNGVALRVMRRLAALPAGGAYQREAERSFAAFVPTLSRSPVLGASAVVELLAASEAPRADSPRSASTLATQDSLRSEDHVSAAIVTNDSGARALRLSVAEGWHINANPASLQSLVATRVENADGQVVPDARYPAGVPFQPEFAPIELSVYQGSVEIVLPPEMSGAPPHALVVHYQACDELRCLPPGKSRVALPTAEAAAE